MPVVIDEMEATVEAADTPAPASTEGGGRHDGAKALDRDELLLEWQRVAGRRERLKAD